MAETITIDNAYIQTYETNVRHLAQQGKSRLRGRIMEKSKQSQYHNWERFGAMEAETKSGQRVATPVGNQSWSRRVSTPITKHMGAVTELEDPVQMLVDPNSTIATAQGMGMGRAVDDIIIDAFDADALTEDGTSDAFDSIITQTVGDGTDEIDGDIIKEVLEKFYSRDIEGDVPKTIVIGEKQLRSMLMEDEIINRDYMIQTALATGILPDYLGFDWVISTRLPAPATDELYCFAFTPYAMGLQVNRDVSSIIAQDPSLSFAWRIYSYLTMGCVRVEDEHIVRIHVADTVTVT